MKGIKITNKNKNTGDYYYIVNKSILKNKNDELILNSSQMGKLSVYLYKATFNVFPPLKELQKYFSDVARFLSEAQIGVIWITPAGMTIALSNMHFDSKQISYKFKNSRNSVSISLPNPEKLKTDEIKRAFMPNLIHSMDGSNIHLLIDLMI